MLDFMRTDVQHVDRVALLDLLERSGFVMRTGTVTCPADRGARVTVVTSDHELLTVQRRRNGAYRVRDLGRTDMPANIVVTTTR